MIACRISPCSSSPCSPPRAGFHYFAEFTYEDVGTVDSGLNSQVLASNNEMVLLPMNEPTHGTPRKSQIQASGGIAASFQCSVLPQHCLQGAAVTCTEDSMQECTG